jgi:hypothetical protein
LFATTAVRLARGGHIDRARGRHEATFSGHLCCSVAPNYLLLPCNSDNFTRGRFGAGAASVPGRIAPWIDAATAQLSLPASLCYPETIAPKAASLCNPACWRPSLHTREIDSGFDTQMTASLVIPSAERKT